MIAETPSPQLRSLLTGHERREDNRCWRPSGTPTALLVYTRAGRAVVRLGSGEEQVVSGGDTVLWAPGARHDFECRESAEPWELVWAHFRPREQWRDWHVWPDGAGVVRIRATDSLRSQIDVALLEMDGHAHTALPRATELAVNALERALLLLDAAHPRSQQVNERVQEAVAFIAGHIDRPLSVQVVADNVRLSPSRLSHLFTQELGLPPARYVELRRMGRARALLETTSLPIYAIAEAVGFSSQFYFATRFKVLEGVTPTVWRREAHR